MCLSILEKVAFTVLSCNWPNSFLCVYNSLGINQCVCVCVCDEWVVIVCVVCIGT